MSSGRRARFGGRGRERAWWLLAAAVLFAVLWAVAQVLAWPVWARATLAGLAVTAALVVPELRAWFKQDDDLAALLAKAAAVSAGRGQLPLVRDVTLPQLRVHEAWVPTPYVQRKKQLEFAKAVGPGQAPLLVGHSMAGKTRLAAQVIQSNFSDHPLLVAESGKALQALVAGGWDPAGVVVWLDDLERFLGADGLTKGLLHRLTSGGAIVVGTIGAHAMDTYQPSDKLRPPEWEALQAFTQIELERGLSETELRWVRAVVNDPGVLAAVQHYGLAEYLGGGPQAVSKFEHGEITHPVGYALVRAAIDWRRTGLTHPIPKKVLATPAMLSIYLADRPEVPRTEEALEQDLKWATEKINETVALLNPRFTDPADITFEAFDYLVDRLTLAAESIPDQMWQLSSQQAGPSEWMRLGFAAYQNDQKPVAETVWRQAVNANDSEAMFNLGVLLADRGELSKAETWWRRAAEAGHSRAMANLRMLRNDPKELNEAETSSPPLLLSLDLRVRLASDSEGGR